MVYKKINKKVDVTQLLEEMAEEGIEANVLEYPNGTVHIEVLKGTREDIFINNHKPTRRLSKHEQIEGLSSLEEVKEYLKGL